MLSLFSIDAKQVEPLLIMAVCAIAGYFMWNHLKASNASVQPSAVDQQGADMNSYMQQVEQMSLLQTLLGTGSSGSSVVAQTASSATTTQSSIPIVAPTPAAPSATASTTSVGSSNPGSV